LLTAAVLVALSLWAYHRWFWVDNIGVVVPGKLYRSAQPGPMQWDAVGQARPHAVVNFCTPQEMAGRMASDRRAARALGADHVHVPIARKVPRLETVREIIDRIRQSPGPVWIHCRHGEDRTGVITAAWRVNQQHWPIPKALAEMRRYRARLKPDKRQAVVELLRRLRDDNRPS
jgi:protein tyrosine/serine phosphatase